MLDDGRLEVLVPESRGGQSTTADVVYLIDEGLEPLLIQPRLRQYLLILDTPDIHGVHIGRASWPGGEVYNEQLAVEQRDDVAGGASAPVSGEREVVLTSRHNLDYVVASRQLKDRAYPQR